MLLQLAGRDIGTFTVPGCSECGAIQTISYSFGPLDPPGPFFDGQYDLAFILLNTIPLGNGAIAFLDGGTVTLGDSATPLPATLPLFATGLGAFGLLGWRRKRKAQAVA
jgi:hypothetical protein